MIYIIYLIERIKIACFRLLNIECKYKKKQGLIPLNFNKKTYSLLLNQKIDLVPK